MATLIVLIDNLTELNTKHLEYQKITYKQNIVFGKLYL